MSIEEGMETVTIKTIRRTRQIVIRSDYGSNPLIIVQRERVDLINDALRSKSDVSQFSVSLSDIANSSFTAEGITATGAQLAALIAAAADQMEPT